MKSTRHAPAILLAAILLTMHAVTLLRYPAPFVDEGWFGSRAWAFRETGSAFGPLDRGVFDRFEGSATYFPWIPTAVQALSYCFASVPTLLPLRIVSLLSGGVLVFCVSLIAYRIGGASFGFIAAVISALSRAFFYSAHLARYDIMVAAFGFAAVALVFRKEDQKIWPDLLSGVLAGLAVEVHPNGCIYAPAIFVLYLVSRGFSVLRNRHFWSFIGGCLAGFAVYAVLHLRYPQTWLEISRIAGAMTHKPPLLTGSLMEIARSLYGLLRLAWYSSAYLLPLAAGSLFMLFRQKEKTHRMLLALMITLPLMHALAIQHKLSYYAVLFIPAWELGAGYLLWKLFRNPWGTKRVMDYAKIAGTALLVVAIIDALIPVRFDWSEDYNRVNQQLEQTISPDETVMGPQTWWFALYDRPWYSWEQLHNFRRFKPASLEDAFREFHPDVLIVDRHLSFFISDGGSPGSYAEQLRLPREEVSRILNKYGHLRSRFDGGQYGEISVYQFDWRRR